VADSPANRAFTTTHWSNVLEAGNVESPAARAALEGLCAAYWYPLYAHVRRRGHGHEDACDLTQEFFAVLLRRQSLANVGPEKGRFRTFLLASLDYFLHDQTARNHAAKRGGGVALVELDALDAQQRFMLDAATDETPDKAFDRRWAAALLEQAFARLASEQAQAGKLELFTRLKPLLAREIEPGEYDALAETIDMLPNTIAKVVQRLRLRARELLIEEAAQTVAAASDAEKELRELFG
jgi:DNA-directed RNA polymerase specialized sigma24 family protein